MAAITTRRAVPADQAEPYRRRRGVEARLDALAPADAVTMDAARRAAASG